MRLIEFEEIVIPYQQIATHSITMKFDVDSERNDQNTFPLNKIPTIDN